jgi:adenine-specific DNA methylase
MASRRFIEEWLPIKEIGVECRRENSTGQHPPPNRLHVWWARRPLTASRAAILGALLPAWEGNEEVLREHFEDRDAYRAWFLRMLGIPIDQPGIDPVKTANEIARARLTGKNLGADPYGYSRAFTRPVSQDDLSKLSFLPGNSRPTTILDSMAGGGSIPFEALRLGLTAIATELNPVACVVLEATLQHPLRYGSGLVDDIQKWADRWGDVIVERLKGLYPLPPNENAIGYLWARTVPCPTTGKPVPLSPNWWLRRQADDSVAVHMLPCNPSSDQCEFEIVRGSQARLAERCTPDQGTIKRGNAISPWTGDPIPGDYIKQMAQSGKMGAQLYALCVDRGMGRDFRLPTEEDLEGVRRAEAALKERWDGWLAKDLIPTEDVPLGNKTSEPRRYGMFRWERLFSPRQLLALGTYLETLRELAPEMERELGSEKAAAVRTYLALVLDKCANYNSMLCNWHPLRNSVANTFDRHDFSFKWSFAEMNMALKDKGGFPWALSQVVDAYKGLCDLLEPSRPLFPLEEWQKRLPAQVSLANAAALRHIPDASVDAVVVDPPYGNNVMYAELSDFFYVWLKRSVGDLYPEWFQSELTDKHTEAVANPALFEGAKGNSWELATRDYLLKMRRAFREMRRVVKPEGAMVVMFTHRQTEMWNALGLALLETGWEIGSSWPVHTESEHSLHQARKNAARSTILLFCRPREQASQPSYWDQEMQQAVRATARRRAQEYQEAGIGGVDLYLSTYGPVLGVLSKQWPILSAEVDRETGQPKRLEPEAALSIARREVFAYRKERLVQGRAASWDPITEWYVLAWDAFRAREFPFDEARKLAISSGIDVTELVQRHRILGKKGDTVRFLEPREREGHGRVDPDASIFSRMVDGLHTAMWLYELEGDRECRRFLGETGYLRDRDFQALVEAAIQAIPRTRKYQRGQVVGFLIPEAETLEALRVTFFPDIQPPQEALDLSEGAEQVVMTGEGFDGDENEEGT